MVLQIIFITIAIVGLILYIKPLTTFFQRRIQVKAYCEKISRDVSEPHVAPFAGFASERRSAADKIALETAITAESGKTGTVTAALDPGEGEFRAIMDRVASNPVSVSVLMQTTGPSVAAVPAPDLRMETPLAHANWRDELGQKLTWMVSSNRQQAELVLNPPQLGRIDVTLTLDGDRASVSFASPHAAVREILENSITRLREVLADAGVTLGQTHVGGDSRHDSNSMHRKNGSLAFGHGTSASHVATVEVPGSESAWRFTAGRGLVDVFA